VEKITAKARRIRQEREAVVFAGLKAGTDLIFNIEMRILDLV
jgi:hypothetical protein